MKLVFYVVGGFVIMAGAALLIARGQAPNSNPVILLAFIAMFAIPPLGAFWMMYMSIRYEKSPLPMVLLAFIPFSFLWYYFERIRVGRVGRSPLESRAGGASLK